MNILFTASARRSAQERASWWRTYRPLTPDVFGQELATAVEQLTVDGLRESPWVPYMNRSLSRLLLPRSGYHLYYELQSDRDAVVICAIVDSGAGGRAIPENEAP